MNKTLLTLLCATWVQFFAQAQDYPLLTEHPDGFKLIDWCVYTHWNCGFTKTETSDNYQKIIWIPLWVVFGPYPGKINDDVLQHKESKVITNLNGEKSTITIDFRLSRKDN